MLVCVELALREGGQGWMELLSVIRIVVIACDTCQYAQCSATAHCCPVLFCCLRHGAALRLAGSSDPSLEVWILQCRLLLLHSLFLVWYCPAQHAPVLCIVAWSYLLSHVMGYHAYQSVHSLSVCTQFVSLYTVCQSVHSLSVCTQFVSLYTVSHVLRMHTLVSSSSWLDIKERIFF